MFDPAELHYDFGPEHPLQALRLVALIDLIESCGLWSRTDARAGLQARAATRTGLQARAATRTELELVHTAEYLDAVEDMILFAMGLSWHWDTKGLQMSAVSYRELLARLFASQGFVEYSTTEPNVRMEPANIFLARIGTRVDSRTSSRFLTRVMSTPKGEIVL